MTCLRIVIKISNILSHFLGFQIKKSQIFLKILGGKVYDIFARTFITNIFFKLVISSEPIIFDWFLENAFETKFLRVSVFDISTDFPSRQL